MLVANHIPRKPENRPLVTLHELPVLARFTSQNSGYDLRVIRFQRSTSKACL
jgi:hypothetical protein